MKLISIKEAQRIQWQFDFETERRKHEYFSKVAKVATMEEDIEEELLRQCRQHVQYLCNDLLLHLRDNKVFDNTWVEAGDQVYAMWRGWV